MWERELETEQNCNILTPTQLAITAFLSRFPGLLNRGIWCPASLGHVPHSSIFSPTHLISNTSDPQLTDLQLIWSRTDWIFRALSYIIVQRPPSCGRHKSLSFNLSTVKVIFWYSSTGCTRYLHRCISYFDSPTESEVNIQQLYQYIIIIIISCWQHGYPWPSLATPPYHSSP